MKYYVTADIFEVGTAAAGRPLGEFDTREQAVAFIEECRELKASPVLDPPGPRLGSRSATGAD